MEVCDSQPLIKHGKRCVLIAVETVYSIDGDVCPLKEMIDVAKETCPLGNAPFIVDETHAGGVLNSKGAGLVCEWGLEREVAVRLSTFGKANAAMGGMSLVVSVNTNAPSDRLKAMIVRNQTI